MKRPRLLVLPVIMGSLFSVATLAQTSKPKASLNHVALFVRDVHASSAFYENIIGLDTIPEPFHDGKHTWLSIGSHTMMHIIEGAPELKTYYKNNHNCFSVPSLETFVEKLKMNNLNWEDRDGKQKAVTTRVDGVKQLWMQDPDGYWVEINDDKF